MKRLKLWVVLVLAIFSSTIIFAQPTWAADGETEYTLEHCPTQGLGWIICPIIDLSSQAADSSYNLIDKHLKIDPVILTGKEVETADGVKTISSAKVSWETFRDIANVLLIITFLVMIFSYITGYGLSDYNIKKTLPKLIAVAILINLSFYLVQVLIDISNIVGSSMKALFDKFAEKIVEGSGAAPDSKLKMAYNFAFTGAVSAIVLNRASHLTSLTSFILPIIVAVVMLIVVTILVLFLRQAVAILVAVLSPVAIASMLLPGADKLFKTWKSALTTVVIAYPAVALLFGAGKLAGQILIVNDTSSWKIQTLMGGVVQVLPMVAAPSVIKSLVASIPIVGAKFTGMISRMRGGAINKAKQSDLVKGQKERWKKRQEARSMKAASPNASLKDKLNSPAAWLGSKTKTGKMRLRDRMERQGQDISNMTNSLTKADADYINGLGDDKDIDIDRLSVGARAAYESNNRDYHKMNLAAAGRLAKERDFNPADYAKLVARAQNEKKFLQDGTPGYKSNLFGKEITQASSISGEQVTRALQRDLVSSNTSDNLALTAAIENSLRTGSTSVDTTTSVYENYLKQHGNVSNLGRASEASLKNMEQAIKNLHNSSGSEGDAFRQIINDLPTSQNASPESVATIQDIIK